MIMKKSFKIAGVIALSIFATGCAKEDGVNTKESKYIELTLTSEATQFIDDSEKLFKNISKILLCK